MGGLDRRTLLRLAAVSGASLLLGGASARRAVERAQVELPPAAGRHPRGDGPLQSDEPPPGDQEPLAPSTVIGFEELADRVVLTNPAGRWHVWTVLSWSADGTRVVGPGYIGRWELPDGTVVVDDLREPGPLNDPRYGGLGAFGWQHARPGYGMWDLHGRLDAARNGGFGVARSSVSRGPELGADGLLRLDVRVEFRDGWTDPIAAAHYRYEVDDAAVSCALEIEQLWDGGGPAVPFVKEPKLVASVATGVDSVEVLGADGAVLRTIDVAGLPDPWNGTVQIDEDERVGVRLLGASALAVTLERDGFEAWAELAESRPELGPDGKSYCLAGGRLKRRWEVAKRRREPPVSCLFHAWEGGSGYPDCARASRSFGPYGERFAVNLRFA
jgi:hypothetical protein